jgi:hypothetical protein
MGAVNGEEHGFGGHFRGIAGADDDLATPDSPHQDNMPYRYPLLCGKTLDAVGHHVAILKPHHKHTPDAPFTCLHYFPEKLTRFR